MSYLKPVLPHFHAGSVLDITPEFLAAQRIRALLLDVDNTLVPWQAAEVTPPVAAWVRSLHAVGVGMCLVSNTHRKRRLQQLADVLEIQYVLRGGKPLPHGFLRALDQLGMAREEAAMVGDQLMTDILGANRLGLRTILVTPLSPVEFWGTRVVHRSLERVLFSAMARSGLTPILIQKGKGERGQ